jgi:hypothetical protein
MSSFVMNTRDGHNVRLAKMAARSWVFWKLRNKGSQPL